MNTLLFFLALPVATIILSITLLKILKCPTLVATTFFAIYLILTYAVFGSGFLIFAIIYTILSYLTTIITKTICKIIIRINRCSNNSCRECRENNTYDNSLCDCIARSINNSDEFNNTNTLNTVNTTSNMNSINNSNVSGICNNGRGLPRAQFTVTTNQENPVLFLGNRNTNYGRKNCCACREK